MIALVLAVSKDDSPACSSDRESLVWEFAVFAYEAFSDEKCVSAINNQGKSIQLSYRTSYGMLRARIRYIVTEVCRFP